jgi:hypothetical protein
MEVRQASSSQESTRTAKASSGGGLRAKLGAFFIGVGLTSIACTIISLSLSLALSRSSLTRNRAHVLPSRLVYIAFFVIRRDIWTSAKTLHKSVNSSLNKVHTQVAANDQRLAALEAKLGALNSNGSSSSDDN